MNAPFEFANIQAPKIKRLNEKALIVQLHVGRPTTSRRDKTAEQHIQREFGDESLTARSRIFRNKDNPVTQLLREVNDIYNWHYSNTWASGETGKRILGVRNLDEYRRTINDRIEALNRMKTDVLPYYDQCVQMDINERTEYARAMGKASTVDASEYPTAREFDERTFISLRLLPLPERSHFLFDVDEQDIAGIDAYLQDIEQAVRVSTIKRLLEPTAALINKISKSTDETKRFHNSLITNVIDAIEAFKKSGVDDDPQLAATVAELDNVVKEHSTGALRDSDVARQQAKEKLAAVADRMSAFM